MDKLIAEIEALPGFWTDNLVSRNKVLAAIRHHQQAQPTPQGVDYINAILGEVDGCELNMSNYNHDSVGDLNNAFVELYGALEYVRDHYLHPLPSPPSGESVERMMDAAIDEARRRERLPTMQRWELEAALVALHPETQGDAV